MSKNKKKNRPKSYMMVGENKICVDDLINAVNAYDKEHGIKLKHPDVWADPFSFRNIAESKADMNIGALICIVNGVKVEDYFETDTSDSHYGTICGPIGVNYAQFTEFSVLEWQDMKTTYNTDSLIFRCRYLTLVLGQIMGNLSKITELEVYEKRKMFRHSGDEQRILLLKDIMEKTIRFVNIILTPNTSYQNIILLMQEHVSYTKRKVKHEELRNLINGHVIETRNNMKTDPITGRFLTDDMCIYNVLKIAYMLATNKTNVDTLPKFKYIEGATVKHDLVLLIEELGAQILSNIKGKKYAPMFGAFVEARPIVWTEFYKETQENFAIRIGILSLAYTKFVFNDKTMSKFIDEMMLKGI